MAQQIDRILEGVRVIPVLTLDASGEGMGEDVARAVAAARALFDGGLPVIEITLRTPAALPAIRAIRAALPAAKVGAGTVLDRERLAQALDAGASFLVSPGTPEPLVAALVAASVPVIPGAQSVTEMMALRAAGFGMLKFFPAEAAGGRALLSSIAGVLPDLQFCPTGGITRETAPDYLGLPNVACVGGSWMASARRILDGDVEAIESDARAAAAL